MFEIFDEAARRCAAGERVALCTVVDARGSTPQRRGARMLVLGNGRTLGTLGGGCVEAEVRKRALELLVGGQAAAPSMTFKLDHDLGWDDGMWCGGMLDVHVQLLDAPDAVAMREHADVLRAGRPVRVTIAGINFVEEIEPAPRLLIAGAGHVAQALASLAGQVGFVISVIDDRADFASKERFPDAQAICVGDVDIELPKLGIDANTYIVIVTRGHHRDAAALRAVIASDARYIGMIGSRRKVRTVLGQLFDDGVPRERLYCVHAPIGLEIGAVSTAEIAVSILAELIAVRRGVESPAAMRIRREDLDVWLDRPRR